jgi:hypothetical protein
MRVRPTPSSGPDSTGTGHGIVKQENLRESDNARDSGRVRTGAAISIAVLCLIVLAAVVLMRLHRGRVVPSAPPVDAPPAAGQPRDRTSAPSPRLERPEKSPISAEREDRSRPGAMPRTREAPAPPGAGGAGGIHVRDRGGTAPVVPVEPTLPEVPSTAGKIIEGLEPADRLPGALVAPAPPDVPAPVRVFEKESTALAQVLGRYEQAYDRLDARLAAAVWPSVDSRALARAFARLQVQDLDFGNCTFAVSANDAAARCAGVLRYARRIGDTAPKTEHHLWTIEFARSGETWQIVRITAQ